MAEENLSPDAALARGASAEDEGERELLIMHVGNVFLDAAVPHLRQDREEHRMTEKRLAFSRLMRVVKEEGVSLLLFSGNLVDGTYAAQDTLRYLCDLFAANPACQFVICTGEVDKYEGNSIYSYESWPDNVHIFTSPVPATVHLPSLGVCVYGWGYAADRAVVPAFEGAVFDKTLYNVLCGTDNTEKDGDTSPLWRGMSALGANYLALTKRNASFAGFSSMPTGLAAYSGSFESEGFGECSPGGVNLLRVEKTEKGYRSYPVRLPLGTLRYAVEHMDISYLSEEEIEREIFARIAKEGYGEETVLRVVYTGCVPPEAVPVCRMDGGRFGVYALQICDESLPTRGASYLEREDSLAGELYRALLPKMQAEDPEERRLAVRAFRMGYAALLGRDLAES